MQGGDRQSRSCTGRAGPTQQRQRQESSAKKLAGGDWHGAFLVLSCELLNGFSVVAVVG
ncbi:hypothetical protein CSIRO_1531 [Bradyrhizobiaceae bacterium SG-6C]|nr:hypothetical protein CSIRO_1531 [Bradyrhizobiaceae bacterium SG-6C]